MINVNDLTADDIQIVGKENTPAPETVIDEQPVTTSESQTPPSNTPEESNEVVPENVSTPNTPEPSNTEQPATNPVSELTGGRFEKLEDLYSEFQSLQKPSEPSYKDDFIKGAVEYYERTGDLTPYLEAKTANYDEMSPEDIHRKALREEYPDLPSSHFEKLFSKKMSEKYNLSEDAMDEDRELGELLMKRDADRLRADWKLKQSEFKAPDPQPSPDTKALYEEWRQQVEQDPMVKAFKSEPKFTVKYGDKEFSIEADNPQELIESAVDNNKLFQNFIEGDASNPRVNYDKFLRVSMYAQNPQKVEKMLVDFGKQMARDELMNELENPAHTEIADKSSVNAAPTGDWRDEFLHDAMRSKKIVKG